MDALRWALAIIISAAIIGLVAFARGEPERGEPTAPAVDLAIVRVIEAT